MSKGRILVVEDDVDISNLLRMYFGGQGYEVQVALRGEEALTLTRKQLPNVIVLDIMLPDMSGYDVCRDLRTTTRTSHIPIIFLTQLDDRGDKIQGLELGADDYITKPFDMEELKLRVQNAIAAAQRQTQIDPRSNLPTGRLIEDQLRQMMQSGENWAYLDLKINNFEAFTDMYGFVAGDEVIRFTALLIGEVIDEGGTPEDYAGHPGSDNFIVITRAADAEGLRQRLVNRFNDEVGQHYSFIDRERGYILAPDAAYGERQVGLMNLTVGLVSPRTHRFSDIREITELATEERRRGLKGEDSGAANLLTSW